MSFFRRRREAKATVDAAALESELRRVLDYHQRMVAQARRWILWGAVSGGLIILWGLSFLVIAYLDGVSVDWRMDAHIEAVRRGGSLGFVLVMSGIIAAFLIVMGVTGFFAPRRAYRRELERLRVFREQNADDLERFGIDLDVPLSAETPQGPPRA